VPRRRWLIASLLGFGVFVNYLDRVNISVSQQALHEAFGVTTVAFGYLLSAYSWTYAALQLPSGVLLDRFGVRKVGCISTFLWSAASFCSAAAAGVGSFFLARLLLGVGEAPTFPGNSKAIGYWFPDRERSLATAFFDSAAKLGPAIGVPFVGLVLVHFGWRLSFAATAIISLLYFALFYALYRNPSEDKKLSADERQFIVRGGAQPEGRGKAGKGASLAYLLSQRKVLGFVLGHSAYNYTFYLLLTWLPSYLSTMLHVNLRDSVLYSSIPWVFAALTDFFIGGWLVNALIKRGFDSSRVRQVVLVVGTALGLCILGAARAHTPIAAIFWISISIGGLAAAAPVGWSIPSLIAPAGSVGRLGGILNFGGQLSAITAPVITGYIASATHSFSWAFAAATVYLLIGIAGYVFLLGRIEPIPNAI
jgi:ACS family D-galactonate transporter-like MFS transporter